MSTTVRPLSGRVPMPVGNYDLGALGFVEEEFLLEGTADSYRLVGERSSDGRWDVEPSDSAPFTTRLLVRRPGSSEDFSGTVVVEWLNVSGGLDAGPDWSFLHRHLTRSGHAWVGVSAQKVGIDGGGIVDGMHLKQAAPERYGVLSHPGDAWSFDIFSRAGRALRAGDSAGLLGPLEPACILAAGESQSAACLVTYINAVDTHAALYDGFFVHGRGGSGAELDGFRLTRDDLGDATRFRMQPGERIRDDVRVPVLVLQSETDVAMLGGGRADQQDGDRLRQWELAGAAHADTYILVAANDDDGRLPAKRLAELLRPVTEVFGFRADSPINSAPQQHYVGQAALDHLDRWAAGGAPPPAAPRLDAVADGTDFHRDEYGIAMGGLRSPWVNVPTATLSGLGQTGEVFSILFGTTTPFDAGILARLYPGGRADYLERFEAALEHTISDGFVLEADRGEILAVAGAAYPTTAAVV
jgi:Alpha/beta hydrolase domain